MSTSTFYEQMTYEQILVCEQIGNEAQPSWLSLIENKGKLSNFFSINQLVGQNIILKKQPETSAKHQFSAIVLN